MACFPSLRGALDRQGERLTGSKIHSSLKRNSPGRQLRSSRQFKLRSSKITSGSQRSSTARVSKGMQSCHYRAAISHYTNSVWNQEFMPQTSGGIDFLKYSRGESRWHDRGVRKPGDVRGAITSSA